MRKGKKKGPPSQLFTRRLRPIEGGPSALPPVRPVAVSKAEQIQIGQKIEKERRAKRDAVLWAKMKHRREIRIPVTIALVIQVTFGYVIKDTLSPKQIPFSGTRAHAAISVSILDMPQNPRRKIPKPRIELPKPEVTFKFPEKVIEKPPPQPEAEVESKLTRPKPLTAPQNLEAKTPTPPKLAEATALRKTDTLSAKTENRTQQTATEALNAPSSLQAQRARTTTQMGASNTPLDAPSALKPGQNRRGIQRAAPLRDVAGLKAKSNRSGEIGVNPSKERNYQKQTLPKLLNSLSPKIPQVSGVKACIVVVEMTVGIDGKPHDIKAHRVTTQPRVDSTKQRAFVKEALAVAQRYRFQPATKAGQPVSKRIRIKIRFGDLR